MKRILIAIHALSYDGAEKVAALWANYLAKNGHQAAFLVRYRLEREQLLEEGISVLSVADTPDSYRTMGAMHRLIKVREIVKQFNPNVVISFLPKMQMLVMVATLGVKCKRLETVRNNPWLDKDVGRKRLLWNLGFLRGDRIILQTEEQAEYFPKWMQKKCVVIHNPILNDPVARQYQSDYPRKFIAVGRVSEQKNYPVMINAFAQAAEKVADCTLDIFGTGSREAVQDIQAQIDALDMSENIHLCGWRRDISEILTTYDAFLLSSDYEGMPNALAEAMAAGLVCLSTDCKTGPKDMIDSGINGFLVTTGDAVSFSKKIQEITQMNLQQCAIMGAAARDTILDMCSEENTMKRLLHLIESEV